MGHGSIGVCVLVGHWCTSVSGAMVQVCWWGNGVSVLGGHGSIGVGASGRTPVGDTLLSLFFKLLLCRYYNS